MGMGRLDPGRGGDETGADLIYIQALIVRRAAHGVRSQTPLARRAPVVPLESLRRGQVTPFQSMYRAPAPRYEGISKPKREDQGIDLWINSLAILALAGLGLSLYLFW